VESFPTSLPAMKRILLVDTSAAMYRYHHSPTPPIMSNYRGQDINVTALHRYLNYTLELSRQFDFDQLVHVLDPEGGSAYRKALYPEYKAGRPPTPPEFVLQKKLLPKVLTAFGQHWVCHDGVESDDVMATLAHLHAERGDMVVVITPDKDLLQLVEDGRIVVSCPIKDERGFRTHKFMDEAAVMDKMGVRPDQVADYLAIMNDDADNIKGVFKAGPVTAAKWLNEFGDLPTLMTNAGSVKGKTGEYLREALPRLPLNQKLTMVLRDVVGVECIDHDPPAFNKALNEQARIIVAARGHWPDSLREIQSAHAPQRMAPPPAPVVPVAAEAFPFESPVTTTTGDDFPFGDEPSGDGRDPGDVADTPWEDPFADDATPSRFRSGSYSF
jgi:5'-3' exonuclease